MKLSNYCCVLIYILQILGHLMAEMLVPPNDPGVDLDDDQEMVDAKDQVGANKPGPHVAQVPAGVRHRPDTRFRMELGDQPCV